MKKAAIIILLQTVLGLFILPVQAQDKLNFSIPLLSEAPEIDGELDNDLWEREALRIDNFLQFVLFILLSAAMIPSPRNSGQPLPTGIILLVMIGCLFPLILLTKNGGPSGFLSTHTGFKWTE